MYFARNRRWEEGNDSPNEDSRKIRISASGNSVHNHSNLKASTGFIREALYEWKNTVAITTRAETTKETTNTHGEMDVLKLKLLNHLFMKYIVTGIEIREEIKTSIRFDLRNDRTIACPELPNTFFIPISFVRDLLTKRTRPNSPNAAINKVKRAKIDTMVLKFFSDEYRLAISDSMVENRKGLSGAAFFHSASMNGNTASIIPGR